MTPQQKIRAIILTMAREYDQGEAPGAELTAANIDEEWDAVNSDVIQEAKYEAREGSVETEIPCEYSRHYESKSVAAQAPDGSWVGWTYWYGGGKHGEPEAIDWMADAYDLACVEEEKVVTVRTFAKLPA